MRIGHGFDVHKFAPNRDLIIGGIKIDYPLGLEGHSDADVLIHAIMDALLGAAGLGDIGTFFPPSDDTYKNANSLELLKEVHYLLSNEGFSKIINIDTVIMAEEPKMGIYIPEMKMMISKVLQLDVNSIGIKATTTEKLGFTGRKEGIAVSAVCLIKAHG
ncbi:MAG: 2-C-methyl-D-erythritol 2,4-cyclodiphosphate synthase [Calditrichaeota bacterium]|nr:MAG: 2-C-methyl-D-erythritol 2,4-cyclodiphosphate synthase [Calditrichota bacterium]